MKLSTFLFPNIMCWILHLSVENFRFLLFTVISVIGVCILIVLCSVFLNWVCWARGNFLASRVTYIFVCVSLRCVECRAGTSIFGHFWWCGRRDSTDFFIFLGSVLACSARLEWWGWRDSTDFLVSLALFWRVRYDWTGGGGAVFNFSLSLVCCRFPWRVDMRGRDIAFYLLWYFVVVSCGFLYSSCWLLTICYRRFLRTQHPEEGQDFCSSA